MDRRAFLSTAALSGIGATLAANPAAADAPPAGTMLLTIFLRHDQAKTLEEINEHLKETGWFDKFPPAGVEIVGWYVMMGIGQVVILRFPAEKLREVNLVVEGAAWDGFFTDFYPTYDYREFWEEQRRAAHE